MNHAEHAATVTVAVRELPRYSRRGRPAAIAAILDAAAAYRATGIAEATATLGAMRDAAATAIRDASNAQRSLALADNDAARARAEAETARAEAAEAGRQNRDLIEERAAAIAEANRARAEAAKAARQAADAEVERRGAQALLEQARDALAAVTGERDRLRSQLAAMTVPAAPHPRRATRAAAAPEGGTEETGFTE